MQNVTLQCVAAINITLKAILTWFCIDDPTLPGAAGMCPTKHLPACLPILSKCSRPGGPSLFFSCSSSFLLHVNSSSSSSLCACECLWAIRVPGSFLSQLQSISSSLWRTPLVIAVNCPSGNTHKIHVSSQIIWFCCFAALSGSLFWLFYLCHGFLSRCCSCWSTSLSGSPCSYKLLLWPCRKLFLYN